MFILFAVNDAAFPRFQIIEGLLHAMRHQLKLSKEASSTLIELSQAIYPNATKDETALLLRGTLSQEAHVRTSCLQALQVMSRSRFSYSLSDPAMEQPFDLTDLDWSPALLVAVHDSDEQNARLAGHIWEDNGLDIPESYLPDLLTFLGKDPFFAPDSI